jgi:hypothetical protein
MGEAKLDSHKSRYLGHGWLLPTNHPFEADERVPANHPK